MCRPPAAPVARSTSRNPKASVMKAAAATASSYSRYGVTVCSMPASCTQIGQPLTHAGVQAPPAGYTVDQMTHLVSYRLRNPSDPGEIYAEEIPEESDAMAR